MMKPEQQHAILEAAAKACGLSVKPMEIKNVTAQGDDRFIGLLAEDWPRGWFNPLANALDTATMCAKLDIDTYWFKERGYVLCCTNRPIRHSEFHDGTDAGKEAAWRLSASIVAAKIGGYTE